jgi:hypothetical protein
MSALEEDCSTFTAPALNSCLWVVLPKSDKFRCPPPTRRDSGPLAPAALQLWGKLICCTSRSGAELLGD